jgi:hypothetical protein
VALLHKNAPEVSKGMPTALPEIDVHFWRYDYPGSADRAQIEKRLVPTVGAYLGRMMVEHLGGRWAPRKKLDESEVVIGDRGWQPFLRARHHLESKQAALDYSLTKYFRVAAR